MTRIQRINAKNRSAVIRCIRENPRAIKNLQEKLELFTDRIQSNLEYLI